MLSEATSVTDKSIIVGNRLNYNIPGFIFVVVFVLFIGWFLFTFFLGIGLFTLPIDLMLEFFTRPKPRTAREIAERKVALRKTTEMILD